MFVPPRDYNKIFTKKLTIPNPSIYSLPKTSTDNHAHMIVNTSNIQPHKIIKKGNSGVFALRSKREPLVVELSLELNIFPDFITSGARSAERRVTVWRFQRAPSARPVPGATRGQLMAGRRAGSSRPLPGEYSSVPATKVCGQRPAGTAVTWWQRGVWT